MINGEVITFLNALESTESDPSFEEALRVVGGSHETDSFNEDGVEITYFVFADRGVEFLLKDGVLNTVFIYATTTDEHRAYGSWASLLGGVEPRSTPNEIVGELGAPLRSGKDHIVYEADHGYVRFDFENEALTMAVIMHRLMDRHAPEGGDSRQDEVVFPEAADAEAAPHIEGELTVFMNALGSAFYSPEHLAAIVLAGPAMETHEDQRADATWVYQEFPRNGVTLQFKNSLLVGALVLLAGPNAYPTPGRLIDGLPLPSSLERIETVLGAPQLASETKAFFYVDDKYVAFDIEEGLGTVVTVIEPGVEA